MPARQKPTFGQGQAAAKVLRRVITVAARVGGRLPAVISVTLARAGGTIEWAVRRRKRRVLTENMAHALGPSASASRLRQAVREEIVNESRRSADFLWSVAYPERAARSMRIDGMHQVREALAHGRGAVPLSPRADRRPGIAESRTVTGSRAAPRSSRPAEPRMLPPCS